MQTYRVSARITISVYTDVEADTPEEAMRLSKDRPVCSVGDPSQNGESADEYWLHSGELDGVPQYLTIEEWS